MPARVRTLWEDPFKRRRCAALLGICLVLISFPVPAGAEYRGSDVIENIGPPSRIPSDARVHDRPLGRFSLDYHVDTSNDNGILPDTPRFEAMPAVIAHSVAGIIWDFAKFLIKLTIDLVTWAFSLDLLNGETDPIEAEANQTVDPDGGTLAPVGRGIEDLYDNVFGRDWLVVGILLAGMWGIWKALVQRRYSETAGAVALSVLFVVVAMFFAKQPEWTVGQVSGWSNAVSESVLSGGRAAVGDGGGEARRKTADHLFGSLLYKPWMTLNFGGIEHCVNGNDRDDDNVPRPVPCSATSATTKRDHTVYAERYLAQDPGSDEREDEYNRLQNGDDPYDDADRPAADIQQQNGAFQRVTVSVVVLLGVLGAVIFLGLLALAVVLAQLLALLVLAFAPVVLVMAVFPGWGHDVFRNWLGKLGLLLVVKVGLSIVLVAVLLVSEGMLAVTDELGFLFAFGLQSAMFWAALFYRRQLIGLLSGGGRIPSMNLGSAYAATSIGAAGARGAGRAARKGGRAGRRVVTAPMILAGKLRGVGSKSVSRAVGPMRPAGRGAGGGAAATSGAGRGNSGGGPAKPGRAGTGATRGGRGGGAAPSPASAGARTGGRSADAERRRKAGRSQGRRDGVGRQGAGSRSGATARSAKAPRAEPSPRERLERDRSRFDRPARPSAAGERPRPVVERGGQRSNGGAPPSRKPGRKGR